MGEKKKKKSWADLNQPGVNKSVGERKQAEGITPESYIKAADGRLVQLIQID